MIKAKGGESMSGAQFMFYIVSPLVLFGLTILAFKAEGILYHILSTVVALLRLALLFFLLLALFTVGGKDSDAGALILLLWSVVLFMPRLVGFILDHTEN